MTAANPEQYQNLLDTKLTQLRQSFASLDLPEIDVFPSTPLHFRMRAEFRIWHEGDKSYYAMTPLGESKPKPIDTFPIGSTSMLDIMPVLLKAIEASEQLRRKLYGAEFLTTRSGNVLITLIYHKRLDDQWLAEASTLANSLGADIVGRSKKQKVLTGKDFVLETFTVNQRTITYQQVETGFTQPNADVNEKMLNWASQVTHNRTGDLLELYCGNGNFTLALAGNFNRVLATEVAKASVKSAKYNIDLNDITNVEVVRMSSEEFTEALNGVRPFNRLKHIELQDYNFSTVFVDPPRAGLDNDTLTLISRFDSILYVSCNPETLQHNLQALSTTHRIERFAVFDQFPYTHHLECGAVLRAI